MTPETKITRTVRHLPGIAKPEASWDDLISYNEITNVEGSDRLADEYRTASALVTSEFMRDVVDPLRTVGRILEDRL